MNQTELRQLCRDAGLGNVGADLDRETLIRILEEEEDIPEGPLEKWRILMERHIDQNRRRLLSQLPGCDGKCTTFGCPDVIVTRCWRGFKNDMV